MIKKISISIWFIILTLVTIAQDDVKKDGYQKFYYSDGSLASEGFLRDGKAEGYWKTYYKNGIIKSEGNRKDFLLDSVWNFYTKSNKLKLSVTYQFGKKNGYRKTYLPDRILVDSFENNIKNNYCNVLYLNGKTKTQTFYIKGLEQGWSYEYATDGRIIGKTLYKNGFIRKREFINSYNVYGKKQGLWKFFYKNGGTKIAGRYRNGIKEGYFKYYSAENQLDSIKRFKDGLEVLETPELDVLDIRTDYYSDGSIKVIASYKDNKAEGVRREYDKKGNITNSYLMHNGAIEAIGIIDNAGKMQGEWKYYFSNGTVKSVGSFIDSKKIGLWSYYYDNKIVRQTGSYNKEGFYTGEWKWYYRDGSKRISEHYFDGQREGQINEYAINGDLIVHGEYVNGIREGEWLIKGNKYFEKGLFLDNMRDGEWKYYYSKDTLYFEGRFVEGSEDGNHIWYYRNGNIKKKGKYIMTLKEGKWKYYSEDGKLLLIIEYKDGIEIRYNAVRVEDNPETTPTE